MRAIATAAGLLVLLQVPACATDLVREDGRFVHRDPDFVIDEPGRSSENARRWSALQVEGSLLSFREPGGASMSLVKKCGPLPEDLQLLSRELLIGLEDREIVEEGPVLVDGAPGWAILAHATSEGRAAGLRTVTRRLGDCSLDWILVFPFEDQALDEGRVRGLEEDFSDWWSSFRVTEAEPGSGVEPDPASSLQGGSASSAAAPAGAEVAP